MKYNLHTHTKFCDGADAPEDIVQEAIKKGFDILGFSTHSLYPFSTDWHIVPKEFHIYKQEIKRLQQFYAGQLEILYGYEADYLPPFSIPDLRTYAALAPDYLIGSVHYISTQNGWFTVDGPVEEVQRGIEKLFNGDGQKAVCTYFSLQREMLQQTRFDIIGHIDVIRKRNNILHFFDESAGWYQKEIRATAEAAARAGVIAEINTGGIARGALDDVYPSAMFLKLLYQAGVPVMINSDAHHAQDLDCAFDRARQCAADAGYRETVCLRRAPGGGTIRQSIPLYQH